MTLPDGKSEERIFAGGFEEKPLLQSLVEDLRDAFFPAKLPPLELTSQPIPVADRMAAKTSPWAIGYSTTFNLLAVAGIVLLLTMNRQRTITGRGLLLNPIDLSAPPVFHLTAPGQSGGSGGHHDLMAPNQGNPPPLVDRQIAPLEKPSVIAPLLAIRNGVQAPPDIRLPEDTNVTMIGVSHSPNVTLVSQGPGNQEGWGTNGPGGSGNGTGNSVGDGCCSNVYGPGQIDTPPVAVNQIEAEFSDQARRQKYQGRCTVGLIIDAQGNPRGIHILTPLGMGLDEKAMEAVKQYRFRPATKNGKPVAVYAAVVVDFRLY